jgi:hypothetical protein
MFRKAGGKAFDILLNLALDLLNGLGHGHTSCLVQQWRPFVSQDSRSSCALSDDGGAV